MGERIAATDAFRSALREAISALNDTESEFHAIQLKRERLQALVNDLEALLGGERGHVSASMSVPRVESAIGMRRGRTRNILMQILEKSAKPLNPSEIHQMTNSAGYSLSEGAIRAALSRSSQTFEVSNGMYSLATVQGESSKVEEATEAAS